MRIDYEYLKDLLGVFLDSSDSACRLRDFPKLDMEDEASEQDHKFVFHMEILKDQGFVVSAIGSGNIVVRRNSFGYTWIDTKIRLSAEGHNFASGLSKPGVLKQLKTTFKDSGPGEVVKLVSSLAGKALDRKLKELTFED